MLKQFDHKKALDKIDPNDTTILTKEELTLGKQLKAAFQNKEDIITLRRLVNQGAPVNYRLDYGLELKLESDFVASLFLILEGEKGEEQLLKNAKQLLSEGKKLVSYIKTGLEFFKILNDKKANNLSIPVNIKFCQLIRSDPIYFRANPDKLNGALIIAAGLRDSNLVRDIINAGKSYSGKPEDNGADVNFLGYFQDNAAVWATILLDYETLEILLDNGSKFENIGLTTSSLLHWVIIAAQLDDSIQRIDRAKDIAKMLLDRGASLDCRNKLGKTPLEYAKGELKTFVENYYSRKIFSPKFVQA